MVAKLAYEVTPERTCSVRRPVKGIWIRPANAPTGLVAKLRGRAVKPRFVEFCSYASGAVPSRMWTLFRAYGETRSYLLARGWVPAHMEERFASLVRRSDHLFTVFWEAAALTASEQDNLYYEAAITAHSLTEKFRELQRELMAEAVREETDDTYGRLQRSFQELRRISEAEDEAYDALSLSYNEYMISTRVRELS